MSLFIADAMAASGQAASEPGFGSLIPLVLIFVIFYFLLLRPQMKRAKEHKKMTESLAKGDEIVTSGGLLGRVTKLDESFITLEVAEGISVKVQRNAVGSLMPKGTLKS
jgi:preprotein translocase subunit YajC